VGTRKSLWIAPLVAVAIAAAYVQSAHAEPLTPLTPGETQFLDSVRQVLVASHDPVTFRSDGELLTYGHYACDKRASGYVGTEATLVDPAITQVAFVFLCP
jgi:hypothetical protein